MKTAFTMIDMIKINAGKTSEGQLVNIWPVYEFKKKSGSCRACLNLDLRAVSLRNSIADREAETSSLRFGGHKGSTEFGKNFR